MSHHQKLTEEIVRKINARKDSYGSVLVKSAIVKHENVWENRVTKILPLPKSDSYIPKEKLDYGDLILFETLISLDSLVEIIKSLPEKGTTTITLGKGQRQSLWETTKYSLKVNISKMATNTIAERNISISDGFSKNIITEALRKIFSTNTEKIVNHKQPHLCILAKSVLNSVSSKNSKLIFSCVEPR